jgi:hypothetical protein
MRVHKRIIIISSILALVGVNCILTSAFPKLKKVVPTETAVPTATIVIPEITIQPTIVVSDGAISITFSESDVLGWIVSYQQANPDIAIKDPVVKLDDGLATITGKFASGILQGDVLMTFTVSLDESKNPLVTVQTMQIGGMDLPDSFKTSINDAINLSIGNSLASGLEGRTIESITIDNGFITVQTTN